MNHIPPAVSLKAYFCDGHHSREIGLFYFDVWKVLNMPGYRSRSCISSRTGLVPMTQSDKYRQFAQEAREQFEHASSNDDKAAWLLIAQSWLNLLPQGEPKAEDSSY
jgi:hypothetical protein